MRSPDPIQPHSDECLHRMGIRVNERFNAVRGARRLIFLDAEHERQVDVFVGIVSDVSRPGPREATLIDLGRTFFPADLFLTKLPDRAYQ